MKITKLDKNYENFSMLNYIKKDIERSNWTFASMLFAHVTIYQTKPLRGASYIPTPEKFINAKSGLVNVRNDDNECLKWCLKYHQSKKAKHGERMSVLSKIEDKYNYENIDFPATIEDVRIFEEQNEDTAINIFEYDESINDIRLKSRSNTKGTDIINLLLLTDEDSAHYVYIKSLEHLFRTNIGNPKILCEKCLRGFTEKQFDKHECDVNENSDFKSTIQMTNKRLKLI